MSFYTNNCCQIVKIVSEILQHMLDFQEVYSKAIKMYLILIKNFLLVDPNLALYLVFLEEEYLKESNYQVSINIVCISLRFSCIISNWLNLQKTIFIVIKMFLSIMLKAVNVIE